MRRRTRLPSLRLLLTAVVVVLGVLSMHAVSGGPHTPRGVAHAMSSGPAAVASDAGGTVAHAGISVQGVVAQLAPPLPEIAAPALPTEPSAAMAAMCVAMLLSLVVALGFRLLGRMRASAAARPPALSVRRGSEVTRAPPPDLLTRLCVLRT